MKMLEGTKETKLVEEEPPMKKAQTKSAAMAEKAEMEQREEDGGSKPYIAMELNEQVSYLDELQDRLRKLEGRLVSVSEEEDAEDDELPEAVLDDTYQNANGLRAKVPHSILSPTAVYVHRHNDALRECIIIVNNIINKLQI